MIQVHKTTQAHQWARQAECFGGVPETGDWCEQGEDVKTCTQTTEAKTLATQAQPIFHFKSGGPLEPTTI